MSWTVITAGPSAGKTSTLRELSARGNHVVPEAARLMIDQKVSEGVDPEDVRDDDNFQQQVEWRDIQLEANVPAEETVFFDRSLADNIAYRRHYGLSVPSNMEQMCRERYDQVFLLDLLPFDDDYARQEDAEEAKQIHSQIKSTYSNLGHEVVEVPVYPIDERVEYILNRLA